MKNRKCPSHNFCLDYGSCDSCDLGTAINKLHNKIQRQRKRIEEQRTVLDILEKYPALLTAFAYDGTWTWEQYQETYSEEDRVYIGADLTEQEFNTVGKWLLRYEDVKEKHTGTPFEF